MNKLLEENLTRIVPQPIGSEPFFVFGGMLNMLVFVSKFFGLKCFLLSALVALLGPCETCERLLTLTGQRCDLLLELEDRRPQLARETGLQRAAALRHLDTFGDLGLFRARRSTLLAASATIGTYIVVIAQFQASEGGTGRGGQLPGNASAIP